MLKVLIADDEEKICQLIQKLIDWPSLDMEVIGVANNGIDAFEKIESLLPDVVITDIRMPGYDGLDLVKKTREAGKDVEFVIISGYRHFEYAQSAIKYGVSDYLLKPIKKDELTETLRKIKDRYLERTEQLTFEERVRQAAKSDVERLRTTCFSNILYRDNRDGDGLTLEEINQQYYYHMAPGCFQIICVKFDGISARDETNLAFLAEKTMQILEQTLLEITCDYEVYVESSYIYILLNYEGEQRKTVRKQCKSILNELMLLESILEGVKVTLGFGELVESVDELRRSLRNARYLIEQRLISGTGKLLEGPIRSSASLPDHPWFCEFNQTMNGALESLDWNQVRETLMKLEEDLQQISEVTGHEILQMSKEVCNLYLFFMKNHKIGIEQNFIERFAKGADCCSSVEELFRYLMHEIEVSYEKAVAGKMQEDNRPIRIAKQYIRDNYKKQITLEDVSLAAGFNSTYFSSLFKKETGKTFLEYLSSTRMEQAKSLLKDTKLNVSAICEEVGYSDVKYFTKGFTKYTGLKPNEYRKLYS